MGSPEEVRINPDEFARLRRETIEKHPTIETIDLDDAVRFHQTHLSDRNVSQAFDAASERGSVLVQPLVGRTTIGQQRRALDAVQDAGADILSTQVDSLSRSRKWDEIEPALRRAREEGNSTLNGFPIVNHPLADVRSLVKEYDLPMELRAYAPDLRLVAETGFSAGYSAFTGNPLYIAANYTSDQSLEFVYRCWQYIYRLVGEYESRGIPILVEIKPLSAGVPLPPAINAASIILDLLIAVSQGVRNVGWVNRPQGNFSQTTAVAKAIHALADRYVSNDDITLHQLGSHWNGVWPDATEKTHAVMALNAAEVILAGAIELYVKTTAEGDTLPSIAETVESVRSTETVVDVLGEQLFPLDEQVHKEAERIETTAAAIIDAALDAGDGDPIRGGLAAIRRGIIDVPFPTSREFNGSVQVARDKRNAIRFSEVGSVPVPEAIQSVHDAKLGEIRSKENTRERMLEAMNLFQ